MSFYTNRGKPALVFELGLRREVQTQRRRGERMSSFFFTVIAADWPPMVTSWVCEESKPSEEGERKCVDIVI